MSKHVVVVESGITASQMKDFWRKVEDGTIDGKIFQKFLENPHLFDEENGVTLVRAVSIFGKSKDIIAEQTSRVWGVETPKDIPVRYSEKTLRQCAEENKLGIADWRIIYYLGQSLREQREKRSIDQKCQPCFYSNDWWLKSEEDNWATKKMEAGYYLINFVGQCSNMTWDQQETEIAKLGDKYERCHEAIFSEAILTIFMVNNGERIAEKWYHWGVSVASIGILVCVGILGAGGLDVYSYWTDYSNRNLRVALVRKFDY